MSDTPLYGFDKRVSYVENNKKKAIKKDTFKSLLLKIIIIILLLCLLAEAVFYLFIVPAVSVAQVNFSGNRELTAIHLEKIAGLSGKEKWSQINTLEISKRLAAFPLIEEARVSKRFPDKVFIEVKERSPVAISFAQVKGRTIVMEIDKTGTIFRIGSSMTAGKLPVIGGLEFENPRAGMKVHRQLIPLFNKLSILKEKNPALLSEISELVIKQKKYGGYDLLIYPMSVSIKVCTDNILNEDKLRYMMLLLDVMRKTYDENRILELDIRGDTAVCRMREEEHE
ncbi:cell division protein FtsQ/DivIB [Treponema phagedenis]|uniref:FtsQ-type POTRA domain-containing protein n=1 Tax=Treponema phagedenis TaxID=162 RepID=A0A0B7GVW8_TREPH|nr:FtsQ-type POTRA domain-containing protein [Treponema phagedenis]NVP24560.1 FtsQ-type POTRA domain-containing protein [Treponema phagedenis]QEJ94742.1 FtsQ-type POTRA domain-containing protein [Treponema phagedenis]QEJ97679.1 FtsQ-type POTRA domain-containing protein [Treponema phagedenis]QEK00648.1 FtsQ-type POTRA domain-containing protein [Treponema phagedenis]QEK03247.1 FtsQ-type POTRA domain-containing protein [Treponema phagedenis]